MGQPVPLGVRRSPLITAGPKLEALLEVPYSLIVGLPRRALASSLLLATLLLGARGHAEPQAASTSTTVTFPYHQRKLLYSRNGAGGLAYVTSGVKRGATVPVVVFLHGMNADEQLHMWFGPPYGDLRSVVEPLVASGKVAPFVLAAPTHTRYATAANVMWPQFDLADFLDATESALHGAAHVDRTRVIVVGHSGAGCNTTGGLLGEGMRSGKPIAVLAVDTCIEERVLPELVSLASTTRLHVFWQRTWPRPIAELEAACERCRIEEGTDLGASNPHLALLPEALRRTLPALLPAP